MIVKVFALTLLFSSVSIFAQPKNRRPPVSQTPTPEPVSVAADDEVERYLSAAESYQLAGNFPQAATANRRAAAIALQRLGFAELEREDFKAASRILSDSLSLHENSNAHAGLAVAYMRLSQNDNAIAAANAAVALDPKNVKAYQILGSLHFSKDEYQSALPALEKVFQMAPDFEGAYLLGMTYLRLQQVQRAKLLFEELETVIKKKSAALYVMFARAFEETDYAQEAEAQFKKALALDPNAPKLNFYYGYFLMQHGGTGRTGEAEKALLKELTITPNDFYSHFFLGAIASGENDHPKAIRYLKKAVVLNAKVSPAFLFLGQSQLEMDDLVSAERNLRRSIELDAQYEKGDLQTRRAYFLLGRLLQKTGRKAEADKALAKARELQGQLYEQARDEVRKVFGEIVSSRPDSGLPTAVAATEKPKVPVRQAAVQSNARLRLVEVLGHAYHNLGVIAVQQGNFDDAFEKFRAASEWKFDLPGLDRNRGIVSFRLEKYPDAIVPLARHLKLNPKDDLARRMLGVSYYVTQNYKQSAITLDPISTKLLTDAELAYFYGIALGQSDRTKEALTFFSKLVDANPAARFFAAQGFVFLGDLERAVREYRTIAAAEPQRPQVHFNAGQALIRLNRFDEAEKEFRAELTVNPSDASSKYHLAFTMIERKVTPDEAIGLLNDAIASRPDYTDALYQLGKLYLENGNTEKAIDNLERAANSQKGKDYVHYQLSLAYRRVSRVAEADRQLKIYRDIREANRTPSSPPGN